MSTKPHEFPFEIHAELDNYVYRLIDPRNGETFYVGRGVGNRVFAHARGEKAMDEDAERSTTKLNRIQEIRNAHLEVLHVIHRHGMTQEVARVVEAALIDAYPGLSNDQGGEGSNEYGPMHAEEIVARYALPTLDGDITEKLVIINVNEIENRSERLAIYEQVRGNWRIDINKAEKADYILAAYRGVIIGAFVANKWKKSGVKGRYCFDGAPVDNQVWEKFVGSKGKRIVRPEMKHIQNPIRYFNF